MVCIMLVAVFFVLMGLGCLYGVIMFTKRKQYHDVFMPLVAGVLCLWIGIGNSAVDIQLVTPNGMTIVHHENKIVVVADDVTQNFINIQDYRDIVTNRDEHEIKIKNKINILGNVYEQYLVIVDKESSN